MANYGDTSAWIRLSYGGTPDYLYIFCEEWYYDVDDESATVIRYPNRGRFGFTLNTEHLVIKLKNVFVTSESDWNVLKAQLKAAQDATNTKLRIQISSTPSYEKYDGTNTIMPVLIKSMRGMTKQFKGDTEYFIIKLVTLLQSDALEA